MVRKRRKNRLLVAGSLAVLLVGGGVAVASLNGGDDAEAGTAAVDEGEPSARGFIEPPIFADRVASGELPPIDERIPAEPFVVGPGTLLEEEFLDWEDGRYGGEIQYAGLAGTGPINISGGATILRSPGQSTDVSEPNIVSALEHDDDYTSYTFTIREGLRWSDGEPVTTEDVRFPFEDLYDDPDVRRPWPTPLFTAGNADLGPAELTVVDDLTFTLTFAQPYGQFMADLNSWIPYYNDIFKPAHYLKQFHARYADAAALDALVAESGRADWIELLASKDVPHWDVGEERALGLPTLNAWVLTETSESRRVFERNPYFWHVDASGHQLPYIDRVVNNQVVDTDAQTNALLAGQVSIATGGEASLNKMSVYTQNAERSGLKVFTTGSFNNPIQVFLNRDFQWTDAASPWQSLMADPEHRFAQAVSAAIDTDAINESVYFGLYSELDEAYQQHDPELAAQLLDDLGMTTGSDGRRAFPDGSPFTLRLTYAAGAADFNPVSELLKQQLEAVGLQVDLEAVEGTLFDQRKAANDIQASLAWNDGQGWASGISEDYTPTSKGPWSPATWQHFITNGAEGRQPDAAMAQFYDLHTARKAFPPASDEGQELYDELLTWMRDNYAFIPTAGTRVTPTVVDDRLRNVPDEGSPVELDVYINAEGMWFEQ
jgi:peptide/nickel transport system substrate-binding protein